MIYDDLAHADLYRNIHPGIARAFDYLKQTNFAEVANGRYELDGSRLFVMVQSYQTRPLQDAIWESHRKYIDVQCIVRGVERFGYVPLSQAPAVTTPYVEEKDVMFYAPGKETIVLAQGQFVVFFPHDIHGPCLRDGDQPSDVIKAVVKVAV